MEKDFQLLSSLVWELRFLAMTSQTAHWRVFGRSSYGDHLLFGRIYEKLNELLDPIAEQLTAISQFSDDKAVCPLQQATYVYTRTKEIFPVLSKAMESPDSMSAFLYEELLSLCNDMRGLSDCIRSGGYLSYGLEDLLASAASEMSQLVFFLERRTRLVAGE